MLKSTKIKYLTVVGTLSIISTAYLLHANSYYKKLHPLEKITQNIEETDNSNNLEIEKIEKKESLPKESKEGRASKKINITKNIIEKNIDNSSKKPLKSTQTQDIKINQYLQVDSSGKLSPQSKKVLEEMLPMLLSLKEGDYIEIEGHSSTKLYSYLTKQNSQNVALEVKNYLVSKLQNIDIVITPYGDLYPIVDDKKDERNSRAELKIRRR